MFKIYSSTLWDIQKRHLQEIYLFQALNTPRGFSRQLYEMVTNRRGLSIDGVIILIQKGQVCQVGACWGFGDVGCTCSSERNWTGLQLKLYFLLSSKR